MSRPVIVIRPEPGCAATVVAGEALGLTMRGFPLFEIVPRAWQAPPPEALDALLFGSANAVRHGGEALAVLRGKPAYAVGTATADAGRSAGFAVAGTGGGGLQALLNTLPAPLRLLRLAGEEHVSLRAPAGISIETRVVYAADPRPMPPPLPQTIAGGAVVLLHSAAAARHFASECDRLDIPRGAVAIAALGARITQAAGAGWAAVKPAPVPEDGALLALAADLCHASDEARDR